MIRELKLGDIPLLQLASGITASEPGLVSGQQVVSYVEGRLSSLGTGTWNGGTVSNATTFDAPVCINYGNWLTYGNSSIPWSSIPAAAAPSKRQIESYTSAAALARPATGQIGQVLHLTASGPAWTDLQPSGSTSSAGPGVHQNSLFLLTDWHRSESLPPGWYKVELVLFASRAATTLDLLDSQAVQTGRVKNVMGMAWHNESIPYLSLTGTSWLGYQGSPQEGIFACVLQMSFLYEHIPGEAAWMGSGLVEGKAGWINGSLRYTSIQKPEEVHNVTTLLPDDPPTEPPTEGPTDPPTEGPTEIPTEVPTEVPTEIPSEVPSEMPEGFSHNLLHPATDAP